MKMSDSLPIGSRSNRLTCAGTGLIALDVIIDKLSSTCPIFKAGGSCTNVLTILSFLGWNSILIGRTGDDQFSKILFDDLHRWGVDTRLINVDSGRNTPIIVEKIDKNRKGEYRHSFSMTCPICGSYLPKYRPLTMKQTSDILNKDLTPCVFYVDRVSNSSVKIAKELKKRKSLIFFEPTKLKKTNLFYECSQLADIIKLSHDKLDKKSSNIFEELNNQLIIETLGVKGLNFRLKSEPWEHLDAFRVQNFRDAAGAGDWCSAGLIHYILKNRTCEGSILGENLVREALMFGQSLSAVNCNFPGARGSMYKLSNNQIMSIALSIMNKRPESFELDLDPKTEDKFTDSMNICPRCSLKCHSYNSKVGLEK
ncbi:hypothetical protein F8E02_02320 [Methanoculleus sp. Wushi-C6]|uniref:Carbohydrate kinase PfkB domain-containing protein n=1 Tax=Methanoculleus caldifontis TaxID=2651577 RepID=A0ABU3WYJ6_9EURY|nr:PfkB family carbohydrate kinase [Methanoculleus sp. Wushi-C6]MDV2480858.1 hypothetical protein [Methanoculleus sp. Wushi-C6]